MGKPDEIFLIYSKDCEESHKLQKWLEEVEINLDVIYKEDNQDICRFYQIEKTPALVLVEKAKPGISTYDAYLAYSGYDQIRSLLKLWYKC